MSAEEDTPEPVDSTPTPEAEPEAESSPPRRQRRRRERRSFRNRGPDRELYRYEPEPTGPSSPGEVRVSNRGSLRGYIGYVRSCLLGETATPIDVVKIIGMGRAMQKAITVVEVVKRRVSDVHQITSVDFAEVTDRWVPKDEDSELEPKIEIRRLPAIQISLTRKPELFDTSDVGYQAPDPSVKVADDRMETDEPPRGRRRGRNRRDRRRDSDEAEAVDAEGSQGEDPEGRPRGRGRGRRGRRNRRRRQGRSQDQDGDQKPADDEPGEEPGEADAEMETEAETDEAPASAPETETFEAVDPAPAPAAPAPATTSAPEPDGPPLESVDE